LHWSFSTCSAGSCSCGLLEYEYEYGQVRLVCTGGLGWLIAYLGWQRKGYIIGDGRLVFRLNSFVCLLFVIVVFRGWWAGGFHLAHRSEHSLENQGIQAPSSHGHRAKAKAIHLCQCVHSLVRLYQVQRLLACHSWPSLLRR
jgi:hypothetical protein